MAALKASPITEAAVRPISEFGNRLGSFVAKAPQYVPIPLPGGQKASMASLPHVMTPIQNKFENVAQQTGVRMGQRVA